MITGLASDRCNSKTEQVRSSYTARCSYNPQARIRSSVTDPSVLRLFLQGLLPSCRDRARPGRCCNSVATIAARMEVDERTVQRYRKLAVELGLLEVDFCASGPEYKNTNWYQIVCLKLRTRVSRLSPKVGDKSPSDSGSPYLSNSSLLENTAAREPESVPNPKPAAENPTHKLETETRRKEKHEEGTRTGNREQEPGTGTALKSGRPGTYVGELVSLIHRLTDLSPRVRGKASRFASELQAEGVPVEIATAGLLVQYNGWRRRGWDGKQRDPVGSLNYFKSEIETLRARGPGLLQAESWGVVLKNLRLRAFETEEQAKRKQLEFKQRWGL